MTYGFIITRHVNSHTTNKYWNQCVKLIRTYYPFKQIIIIDDNSNQNFVSADCDYQNIQIIQSEYPKRGELLPYIYFLKHKWFDNAVIMHDSVFIHKRIPFELFTYPVLPLWHHNYDKENLHNLLRICSNLKNNSFLKQKLHNGTNSDISILGMQNNDNFNLCFGVQAYINLHFLEMLENKYNITNMTSVIKNRTDRCSLERIMGLLFCQEYPKLKQKGSIFGNIHHHHQAFKYTYNNYLQDFNNKKACRPFVKVWTGR